MLFWQKQVLKEVKTAKRLPSWDTQTAGSCSPRVMQQKVSIADQRKGPPVLCCMWRELWVQRYGEWGWGAKEPERHNSGGVRGPRAGFFWLVTWCPWGYVGWGGWSHSQRASMPSSKRISNTQKNLLASMYPLNKVTLDSVTSGPASS